MLYIDVLLCYNKNRGFHAQAFECLAILEGTSAMAQAALQQNTRLRRDDTQNISAYFNKVPVTPALLALKHVCCPHARRAYHYKSSTMDARLRLSSHWLDLGGMTT